MKAKTQNIPNLSFEGKPVTRVSFKEITGREWYKNNPATEGLDRGIYPDKKLEIRQGVMGLGLHAGEELKPGDFIVDYIGMPITHDEMQKLHPEQHRDIMLPFDSRKYSNEGVLINHGVPNASIHYDFIDNFIHRVMIIAIHKIEQGEEILYNYGSGYVFNTIESVNVSLVIDRCNQLYNEVKNASITSKPVGSYKSSEYKLNLDSFKPSSLLLKNIQQACLLEYIFTRPLVLFQLRESKKINYEKLKILWKQFLFSDPVRELRAHSYPWYSIAFTSIIMHFDDYCFNTAYDMGLFFKSDDLRKESDDLRKNAYSYDEFSRIKCNQLCKLVNYHGTFKNSPQAFSHLEGSFKSIVDKLVKYMLLDSGKVLFTLDYRGYFDKIFNPVMKNEFLKELSETLPILADCLYDEGIKFIPNLKESLDELIRKIMPEKALSNLIDMTKNLKYKITTLYQTKDNGYNINGVSYHAKLSVKVSSTTLAKICHRAESHNIAVGNKVRDNKKYEVYFGRG